MVQFMLRITLSWRHKNIF